MKRGANKKKILVTKSEGTTMVDKKLLEQIENAPVEKVEAVLKAYVDAKKAEGGEGVDERLQMALKAVTRILTPFKGQVPAQLLKDVLGAAEVEAPAAGGQMADEEKKPTPEQEAEAKKAGEEAYCAHLKKLGFEQYPTQQIAQKGEQEPDDEEDEMEDVEKKEDVLKSILSGVPKESRKAIEAFLQKADKENESLRTSLDEFKKSQEDLKIRLEAVTKAGKRGEFVKKAASWKHLGADVEKLADALMTISDLAPKETVETIEKALGAANEQISKGNLYGEIGSAQPNQGRDATTTWAQIEKAAEAYVAKSGEKLSTAQAVDRFMLSDEGRAMYRKYDEELREAARRNG